MKSRSVFVTMEKSLYQPLSLFWYFRVLLCVCVCWKKKSSLQHEACAHEICLVSVSMVSRLCVQSLAEFFLSLAKLNDLSYISNWNWSWASTHSLSYPFILWNENLFFRCLRTHVFPEHKTRIEWAENVNVRFEFAVNYLLDDICAVHMLTWFSTRKIGHIEL